MSSPAEAEGDAVAEQAGLSFLPQALTQWIEGLRILPWSAGCLAVIALVLFFGHKMRLQRRAIRQVILGLPNGARFRVVDAMVHCVWNTRKINPERLNRAVEIARNTTNMDYTKEHLREAALRADRLIIPTNFRYMGEGLSHAEKMVVFNSAVSVMLADGPLTQGDRSMLKVLARGLRLRRHELRQLSKLIPA